MGSANSERLAELIAFDETKAGVKGLVDSGISTIPSIFIHPNNNNNNNSDPLPLKTNNSISIPILDFVGIEEDPNVKKYTIDRIRDASESWGIFQVVNHGIPITVLDEMLEKVRGFFEQDDEVKKSYYTRDYSKKVIYNSNFDLYSGLVTNWRDTFVCMMAPDPPSPQDLPAACREILIEYSKQVMRVGKMVFELLSEALGLSPNHLNEMGCAEGLGVLGHYYPACPKPELTMGTSMHSDPDFLTVLLQDQIGGLQVFYQNQWFDVPPTPGALVINIGDVLQLISNDKFKSVEHRVLSNRKGPRMSVACFFSTRSLPTSIIYGPIKELLSDSDPPLYRETTMREYFTFLQTKGFDDTSTLQHFRI